MEIGEYTVKEKIVTHKFIPNELIILTSKAVYKISYLNEKGTGFFLNVGPYKFLVTNFHVVSDKLLDKYIEIEMHNKKKKIIILDKKKRLIQFFKDPIDITIIQINEDDVIQNVDFWIMIHVIILNIKMKKF